MATSEVQAPVDFSGYWKLQRNDEHFDKYLQSMGVNFLVRKLIKSATVYQDVEQKGNSFQIKMILPVTVQEQKFVVGEQYDFFNSFDKETTQRIARWEGNTLVITSVKENTDAPEERRTIEEGVLVLALSKGGVTTKRYFEIAEKKK